MIKEYLSDKLYNLIIKNFSFDDITEIRFRLNMNIIICVKNKKYFLKDNGEYVIASQNIINDFVRRISENSLYAFNDSIINGYITLPNGVRVGLCGTVVMDKDRIVTIKDFQSVNIRIPHFVKNCSLPTYELLFGGGINNTLIISPPGAGKTTFLKDIIYQLEDHGMNKNILVVDERCELSVNATTLNIGQFCDVYKNCSKSFAFKNGIRSMTPDIIVTDELNLDCDLQNLKEASNCGVKIIATIHAESIDQLRQKKGFNDILENKYFARFVVLSNDNGPGTIKYIFDEKQNCLFCGSV